MTQEEKLEKSRAYGREYSKRYKEERKDDPAFQEKLRENARRGYWRHHDENLERARKRYEKNKTDPAFMEKKRAAGRRTYHKSREKLLASGKLYKVKPISEIDLGMVSALFKAGWAVSDITKEVNGSEEEIKTFLNDNVVGRET